MDRSICRAEEQLDQDTHWDVRILLLLDTVQVDCTDPWFLIRPGGQLSLLDARTISAALGKGMGAKIEKPFETAIWD